MEKSSQNPSFGQGLELAIIIEKAIVSAVKKTNANLEKIQKVIGQPGVIFNFFEGLFADIVKAKPSILRIISSGEIIIEALDGKAYISCAKNIFTSLIDENFKNWGLNRSGPATAETLLNVSEIVEDRTLVQIFTSISSDLEKLVMTQAQIIYFCEKYPTRLRQEGYATFFLTKVSEEYFVVSVFIDFDGLYASVRRLGYDYVWLGENRHCVVSPQFMPLAE